jgi:hypothetical protein
MSKQVTTKKLTNLERGKRMFEAGVKVERINDNLYKVPSESRPGVFHEVIPYLNVCSCENFERYAEPCKHFYLVQFIRLKEMLPDSQVKALSKVGVVLSK